jgi:predicted regulator of Ras-like GTPase activity (Roadblock/LC7/MglB family)
MRGMGEVVYGMVKEVPGMMAVIFIDKDGIPLVSAGEFDFDSYDLGAIGAACLESCQILGGDLGQFWIENVIIEFDDWKVFQCPTDTCAMLILANKCADVDAIRQEAKNNIESLSHARGIEWSQGKFMPPPMLHKTQTDQGCDIEPLKLIPLFGEKA